MVRAREDRMLLRQREEMTTIPDISVVMGVYNGARYLRETIICVLSQEKVSLEFIIVDDGSTDKSLEILQEYAQSDPRVKILHQENEGLTSALIRGCEVAQGKYIARHDVGDVSQLQRLYQQKRALDADESLAFVSCWTEYCGPEWEFLYLVKGTGVASMPNLIISERAIHGVVDGPTHHGAVMFRRANYIRVGGYRREFYYGQDWDLWYRLGHGRFQMVESALYMARIMPGSISMADRLRQETISRLSRAALNQRLKQLPEQTVLNAASKIRPVSAAVESQRRQAQALYFIGECLRRNGDRRALHYFKESIRDSPLFVKSWVRLLQGQLREI